MTTEYDSKNSDVENGGGAGELLWGVEIKLDSRTPSFFRSARRVVLDDEIVQLLLTDGAHEAYAAGAVLKVLAMRAT